MTPSIAGLLDSIVRIWRPSPVQDGLGVEQSSYALVGEFGAAFNRSTAPVAPVAGGLAPTGRLRIYLPPDADVQPRDVVQVVSGPVSHLTWEVDEPPTRLRGHHTQLDTIAWEGDLEQGS